MNERWSVWQQKIDSLTLRERATIMIVAVVGVFFILQLLLIDPVIEKRQALVRQVQSTQQDVVLNQSQVELLSAQISSGIGRKKNQQLEDLQLDLNNLNQKISESVKTMIPPKKMAIVLEGLLEKGSDLKLLSLENKPVVVVNDSMAADTKKLAKSSSDESETLYNHGFILRLSGNYMSVLGYFESLSALPWRFYWDDLRYKVENYPNAEITLEIHTISTYEEWIGV